MAVIRVRDERQKSRRINQGRVVGFDDLPRLETEKTWEFFVNLGFVDGNKLLARNYSGIEGVWKNEPCYIIGGGPPLAGFILDHGWEFFRGKHTIGINHVIEDWDGFEWFFFLDRRFIEKTTYDLGKYRGRIFAQSTTGMKPQDGVTIFRCRSDRPGLKIEDGLYSGNFGGLAALNLALITGANPIYLIGFGMGTTGNAQSYHYKLDYSGEDKTERRFLKFKRVQRYFERFRSFSDRIIHVTDGKDIPVFKKIKSKDIKETKIEVIPRKARIVHLSFTADILKHADITRHIVGECTGVHSLHSFADPVPAADFYVLEHFLSTDKSVKAFPHKNKAIDIVHTVNCIPPQGFRNVITLTKAWQKMLLKYGIKSEVLTPGIDLEPYQNIVPDYSSLTFGRMTRWSPGKIHPAWNGIVKEILDELQDSRCLFFCDNENKSRERLNHPRMTFDNSCKINMFKGEFLKRLGLYVHVNGSFKETLSFALIEAMATGLPIIYLSEGTGVLEEVVGDAGQAITDIKQVKQAIIGLLKNPEARKKLGTKAKERSLRYCKNRMIRDFDSLIMGLIK